MQDLIYVCAQPSTFYYAWQIDAMLYSFSKNGVILSNVHIVSSISKEASSHFKLVENKWSKRGVLFEYYKDTRSNPAYISSIRPHILTKHWQKHPELVSKHIFYHDCDIALSKPIPNLLDKLNSDKCHLSDTINYIGAKYIESKENNILEKMCAIIDIDIELVRSREDSSGGAQYLMKPGIDITFWEDVYKHSEKLFDDISRWCTICKRQDPDWHELQIWCADMWAVLWNLWKRGYDTVVDKDLDFAWGTSRIGEWERTAIFHNAGVTASGIDKDGIVKPFNKSEYMYKKPIEAKRPGDIWASQKYYDFIVESWNETRNPKVENQQVVKKVVKKQTIRKRV